MTATASGENPAPAFAFSVLPGEGAWRARALTLSLVEQYASPTLFAHVVREERADVPEAAMETIRAHATVLDGEIPLDDYPVSAKLDAVVEATRRTDDPVVLLDSDTLALRPLDEVDSDADLQAKPVDTSQQYWATPRPHEGWQAVYEATATPVPEWRVETTVDEQTILPYYNAGVVAVDGEDVARRWHTLTEAVRETVACEPTFADQIALGLLAAQPDVSVSALSEASNWPLPLRRRVSPETAVVHYHDYPHLDRVWNPKTRRRLLRYLRPRVAANRSTASVYRSVRSWWWAVKTSLQSRSDLLEF